MEQVSAVGIALAPEACARCFNSFYRSVALLDLFFFLRARALGEIAKNG